MPSKNMLPKGKRRQSVKQEYRAARTLAQELASQQRSRSDNFGDEPEQTATALLRTADFMETEPTIEERIAANDWMTTRGASGSKVAEETHESPRYANPYAGLKQELKASAAPVEVLEDLAPEDGVLSFSAPAAAAGMRLDAYLAKALPDISRGRVQLLTENNQVRVDGKDAKSKLKLKGGEQIEIEGEPQVAPLDAEPENIPLRILYEDDDLAIVDKPAGMMVHAGAGSAEQNRGTLVNALLYYFGQQLSGVGGTMRPGIVHRLDKQTSGLIVVAKNDVVHRKLAAMFAERAMRKQYIAVVHGWLAEDEGTVKLPIARDLVRRTRMTTRRTDGRSAVSHWRVIERVEGPFGRFTVLEVRIETGRTHQIRVHMQAIGHPVVGDFLYGAPHRIDHKPTGPKKDTGQAIELPRNFLHAAELAFTHPRTGKPVAVSAELPPELKDFLDQLRGV
jgi:23S rRNA pseudouridine1911/1915/1917 synthase